MDYLKSDNLSSHSNLIHGFVYLESPINIDNLLIDTGLKNIKTVKQVHGNNIINLNDISQFGQSYEADAVISGLRGYGVGVYTADCVPIIIFDAKEGYYGVIHAGWKGTLSGIAENVSDYLILKLGCKSENIAASIGPCIEGSCYEVGGEVAEQFYKKFNDTDKYVKKKDGGKYNLDLKEANILQLKRKGIYNVEAFNICTKCDLNYPSYRRDGKNAGRMLSFVGLV